MNGSTQDLNSALEVLETIQTYRNREEILQKMTEAALANLNAVQGEAYPAKWTDTLKIDEKNAKEIFQSVCILVQSAVYDTQDVLKQVKGCSLDPNFKQFVLQHIQTHSKSWQELRAQEAERI